MATIDFKDRILFSALESALPHNDASLATEALQPKYVENSVWCCNLRNINLHHHSKKQQKNTNSLINLKKKKQTTLAIRVS